MSAAALIAMMIASFCSGVIYDRYPWIYWAGNVVDELERDAQTTTGGPGSEFQQPRGAISPAPRSTESRLSESRLSESAQIDIVGTGTGLSLHIPSD